MEGDAVRYENRPLRCRQDFDLGTKYPNGMCDLKKQETWVKEAKTKWGGHFVPELAWWEESFSLTMREIGNLCSASLFFFFRFLFIVRGYRQPVIALIAYHCL